ncbi:hypothetical protein [Streptomyces pseudovenezuelae]|uniref:hypothetical protein n=1 Tax=Streptomyces pseudovenezuelae TaxID=67350 RepID=UPI002E813F5D|nr:hypothetical protein [Streptomyces pseudovenezuelae]WUA94487.1 hypothetical protein OHO81_44745 [Streptomyces pseudovenezuelae]
MTDRQNTINQAIDALQTGTATPPDGQDPQSMANMLRTASDRGGLGAYAAYKTAQRINAQTS